MAFQDQRSADLRLIDNRTPLTEEEIRDLMPWARVLSSSAKENLRTELSLLQLAALKRQEELATRQLESFAEFDKSTASANRWMLRFTVAVTIMTLVMMVIGLYPLVREHSGGGASHRSDTQQPVGPRTAATVKAEEVKADTKTWENAEVAVTCSGKEHLLPGYSMDGRGKQVTLNCTIKNLTDKALPLAASDKVDALFRLPDGRVVRGRAYLGSNLHEIPARGEISNAGLFPSDNECPPKESDYDCAQAELMKANELLLTDTVSGVRYHVRVE